MREDWVEFEKMKESIHANQELMSFFNPNNSKDNIKDRFEEEIDSELLNFINTKLEFYNKMTERKLNRTLKDQWFSKLYDSVFRGLQK